MTQKQARCWANTILNDKDSIAYKATELLLYEVDKDGDWDWDDLSHLFYRIAQAIRTKPE